jgi:hypothetical protein
MKSRSEKAGDAIIDAAGHIDFNRYVFAGHLMNQSPEIQTRVVGAFVVYLKLYKHQVEHPNLPLWSDSRTMEHLDSIDLTEFDR